jgi:hypothetical protein
MFSARQSFFSTTNSAPPPPPPGLGTPFIMTIDTSKTISGQANTEFRVQLQGNGTADANMMTIHWGDGNTTTAITGLQTHTYPSAGNYTVEIYGNSYQTPLSFSIKSQAKVTDITQWGNHQYSNMANFLYFATSGWNGAIVRNEARVCSTAP